MILANPNLIATCFQTCAVWVQFNEDLGILTIMSCELGPNIGRQGPATALVIRNSTIYFSFDNSWNKSYRYLWHRILYLHSLSVRLFIARSRRVSKHRDWLLTCSHHSKIRQTHQWKCLAFAFAPWFQWKDMWQLRVHAVQNKPPKYTSWRNACVMTIR